MSQIVVTLTGDEARLIQAYQKAIAKGQQMDSGLKKMSQSGKQAGASMQGAGAQVKGSGGAFGSMLSKIGPLTAGFVSVSTAVGTFKDVLASVRAESERAMESFTKLDQARALLSQIAVGGTAGETAADIQAKNELADRYAAKYGVERDVARQVVFASESEGFQAAAGDVLKYSHVMGGTEGLASVAGQVPTLFKGEVTAQEAMSGSLVAAGESRLDFNELSKGLVKLSEGGALANASFEETAGIMSVMASRFASGDIAATRFKAFSTKLGMSEEFGGKGIVGGFEALQSADEATRKEFLGDSNELNQAYKLLSDELPNVKDRIADVKQEMDTMRAGGQSGLERKLQGQFSEDTVIGQTNRAKLKADKARIALEIEEERRFARQGFERREAIARKKQELAGRGVLERYGGRKAAEAAEGLQLDKSWTSRAIDFGSKASPFGFGIGGWLLNKVGGGSEEPPPQRQGRPQPNQGGEVVTAIQELKNETAKTNEILTNGQRPRSNRGPQLQELHSVE